MTTSEFTRAQAITEADLQAAVIGLARLRGWRVHHSRPAINRRGEWSTPIQGSPGAPDLFMARRGVVLAVELKSEAGKLSPDQLEWAAAAGTYWLCWRPSHWLSGEIAEVLA